VAELGLYLCTTLGLAALLWHSAAGGPETGMRLAYWSEGLLLGAFLAFFAVRCAVSWPSWPEPIRWLAALTLTNLVVSILVLCVNWLRAGARPAQRPGLD